MTGKIIILLGLSNRKGVLPVRFAEFLTTTEVMIRKRSCAYFVTTGSVGLPCRR